MAAIIGAAAVVGPAEAPRENVERRLDSEVSFGEFRPNPWLG
jgi:hypothetical protein